MTTPLDDVATALVAAKQHVSTLTAERDALLARVNELDDEVARLVGERSRMRDCYGDVIRLGDTIEYLPTRETYTVEHISGGHPLIRFADGDLGRIDSRSDKWRIASELSRTTPEVSGAPLAATAMALELVADCWERGAFDVVGFKQALREKARELREGK